MDLSYLIKTFYELKEPNDCLENLTDTIKTIEKANSIIISNLNIFFEFINTLLASSNKDFLIKGLILTEHAIKFIGPELDIKFGKIIQNLILTLSDPEAEIRKKSIQIFLKFVKKTRNLPLILKNIITYGLKHKIAYNRIRSLNILPELIDNEKTIFFSNVGINAIAEIFENLTICLFDNDLNVRKEAEETINKIQERGYEGFNNPFNKLSIEHQISFMKVVDNHRTEKRQEKFIELTLNKLGIDLNNSDAVQIDLTELKKQFYLSEIPIKKDEILIFFPKDYKKNLYFGFLEENLLIESLNVLDLKSQSLAIQEMSSIYLETNDSKIFINYLSTFYKYLLYLLKNADNFQIIMNILNLLNSILNIPGIQSKIYLPLLTSILVEKLIEERVLIRNQINALLKKVMKTLKPEIFLKIITFLLFDMQDSTFIAKKNVWHLYEEGLFLICILFLDENSGLFSNKQKEFPFINLNLKDFLIKISSFLDHKTQKVKKAALETLAVICASTDSKIMLEILHEILGSQLYDELLDKLEKKSYFFLNKNGFLELLLDKKEEVIEKIQVKIEDKLEDIQEKDSSNNENLEIEVEKKLQLEFKKWENPMTQRDRFIKRNEEFEKMVIGDDMIMTDDEQAKNEIYVPIHQIPITNPQKDMALIAYKLKNNRIGEYEENERDTDTYHDNEKFENEKEKSQNKLNESQKNEKKSKKEESFDAKSEQFSIVYSEEDANKQIQKTSNISKIIQQNKENYLGYKFDGNNDKSDDDDSDKNFDENAKLPFEETNEQSIISLLSSPKLADIQPKEIPIQTLDKFEEIKPIRPNTNQIKTIKDTILKEFLGFDEDIPLWSPSKSKEKPFSPLKSRKNSPKKKFKNGKELGSELDMYFMSVNDLYSLENPGFAMHKLLLEMKSDKWEDQNNALVTIRRLAKNHKEQLYDMNLSIPHLISDICDLSNSYNSIVCKQAILTLIDLSETLKGNLDIGLDPIISLILNKNSEYNVFIGDELNKLMRSVAKHGDGNKIMFIISTILSKSGQIPPFKGIIAQIIALILDKYQTNVIHLKNFPKLIVLLVQLITDQSYSVRQISKRGLFNLLNSQFLNRSEFEEVLKKNLPEKEFQDVKKFIEKHKMLIDQKFIEGMNPEFVIHWEESSYRPTEKDSSKQRPNSHLLRLNKNLN